MRVSDGALDDAETITITVNEVNVAPTADAGADQFATLADVVMLDGSGSRDPDTGDSLTYGWMQTSGPPAALNDGAAVSPTFTASVTGTLTFQLTVTDTGGLSDHATTVVTVTAPDVPTHTLTIYIEGQGRATSPASPPERLLYPCRATTSPARKLL